MMMQSEDMVVSDFNCIYTIFFPNVQSSAISLSRPPSRSHARYYTDLIDCFEMMLQWLSTLERSGKFDSIFDKYSIETAIVAFSMILV